MQKTIRLMPVLMALAIVVSACVPQQATTTQNPQEVAAQVGTSVAMTIDAQGQIATFVAQTVEAQNTGTAAAQPSFTQTALPVPTSVLLPTVTPFVISGGGGGGGGGGSSSPKQKYDCQEISTRPGEGTHIIAGKEFDVVWVFRNNGTKKWEAGWVFSFLDGTNFSTTGSYALGRDVEPGDTYQFELDAIAPEGGTVDQPKLITMQWALRGQGVRFCRPWAAIYVP
jgi:hypothetical protein